jgi:hypothetical protein
MRDPDWLKEPDPSGEAVIYVSIPENAKLTPEVVKALTELGKALQAEDAADKAQLAPCPRLRVCSPFRNCQPLASNPCFRLTSCRIKQ